MLRIFLADRCRNYAKWLTFALALLAVVPSLLPAAERPAPQFNFNSAPPRELSKVSLPAYRIEPPDLVQLIAVKLVPLQPYRIGPRDLLQIRASGTLIDEPLAANFIVQDEGAVDLGPVYGKVRVAGLTIEEAKREIVRHLKAILSQPAVSIVLAQAGEVHQINRNYNVLDDGTINLGMYGAVSVSGKTITEARLAVERQLSLFFDVPQVGLDVVGYKSQKYYIITAGAQTGEPIMPVPITGNETVLDALSQIRGLPNISSKTMWLARPAPSGFGCEQVLPIDWVAITRGARADTNYQILPGDRLYIVDDKLLATDNYIARFTRPIERLLSTASLGATTIQNLQTLGRNYNQNRSTQ